METISKFVEERNQALFSLDEKTILAYMKKYKVPIPSNKIVFWASVHKSICNITNAPNNLKQQSERWLRAHGMSPEIH